MPGLLENTVLTGYSYVDPYVQKTRNAVPLFDKAAHQFEERVPPLIHKVDEFAEPTIQRVEKTVEPIYKEGVKKAGEIKGSLDKAKKVASGYYKEGVKETKEIGQDIASDVRQLPRVRGMDNVLDLKTVSKVNKVMTFLLDKADSLIDRYLPAGAGDSETLSNDSFSSTKSSVMPRMLSLPGKLGSRLLHTAMSYVPAKEDLTLAKLKAKAAALQGKARAILAKKMQAASKTQLFKTCISYVPAKEDLTLAKLKAKAAALQAKARALLAKKMQAASKTQLFKTCLSTTSSTLKFAEATCEKLLGKERTQQAEAMVGKFLPASFKTAVTKLMSTKAA